MMSLNSIGRLPPEILAEIFRCCDHERSTFDLSTTIWTLGRVCKIWREVSIGEPHIWTRIWVKLDDLANRKEEGSIEMLRTVLDRSQTAGLGLHIHIILPEYHSEDFYQKIIDAVREESHRWVSLEYISESFGNREFDFTPAVFPDNNFHSVDGMSAFPALREVEISTRFMDEESDHRLFRAIGTSPVLEKLTLFNMDYDMDNIRAVKRSIPWGQLKHLGILAGNSSLPVWILVLRGILQECSTLEHLVVDQSPWDVSAREETSELEAEEGRYPTLSTLRSLDIRKNGRWGDLHEPHLSMWSIGKFPALEHLALSNFNLCQNIAHLNMAFADSCLELRSLTLRDIALSDFTVERFLREHGGHIRVLTLQGQLFDHLFECIAASEGEMFLPNLEKLVVKMDERTVISPSLVALINVIRARASNDGTSRLTAVDVEIYAEDEEIEPVEELEAMNNTELRIQVRRIETVYYDGTEVNEIARFGRFLNTALYRQSWDDIPSSHFHENMPILDNIFTRFENCSSQVYEDRSYVHELSALRHVLEKFVKGVDALPEDYDFAKRAERLLDDRFGWNPNGRKRRR